MIDHIMSGNFKEKARTLFYNILDFTYSLPLHVVLIVISRDLIILLCIVVLFFLKIEVPISPNIWGKLTTLFQMLTILCVLLEFPFSAVVWNTAWIFTLISGVIYIKRGVTSLNAFDTKNRTARGA